MTKRKTAEEKAARPKKPKKLAALSASASAATKATIARNAETSLLLKLPAEIRRGIWTEVLGENLVHLSYIHDDDLDFESNEQLRSAWRHLICQEDCKESRPDEKRTFEDTGKEIFWFQAHQFCDPDYHPSDPIEHWDHETMRLTILRASSQIYVEANQVLWASNTFSFADATTFKRFMMTRNTLQKRLIRSLRLDMDWFLYGYKEWNSALNMPLIRSLPGLRNLRVHITHRMESQLYDRVKDSFLDYSSVFDGLRKLSTLPLASAEVFVRIPKYSYSSEDGLLKAEDTKEIADGLQKILLDPKGAEIYAEARRREQEQSRKYREALAKDQAVRRRPLPRA